MRNKLLLSGLISLLCSSGCSDALRWLLMSGTFRRFLQIELRAIVPDVRQTVC